MQVASRLHVQETLLETPGRPPVPGGRDQEHTKKRIKSNSV